MTKDVLITIRGLQFVGEEDTGPVEVITKGNYYKRDGKHYIIYEEVAEGIEGVTKSLIKLDDEGMEVRKRGATSLHMVFEKNRKSMSYYDTPFGNLMIGVDTRELSLEETSQNIVIKLSYQLEMNYSYFAEGDIYINVKSKEAGDFVI